MSRLQLSAAIGDYDITRGLLDGRVAVSGIELVAMSYRSPHRHWRMLVQDEFDVGEMSLGAYVSLISRGDDRFVALPIFPQRRFRHSYVFVSGRRDVRRASELRGTRVGIRAWEVTAGVYMRGILADRHDLPVGSIDWVAQDADDVSVELPADISLERVEPGRSVIDLCAQGELAGLIFPDIPDQVHAGTGEIRRLFDDPWAEEERYYRDTGIFPIMHLVVVRRELVERHPWICRNLMDAFRTSKQLAIERMRDPRTVSLAWFRWLLEREQQVLGTDPWVDGIEPNRHVLDTFLRYAHEQGLTTAALGVEELFAEQTRGEPPRRVAAG